MPDLILAHYGADWLAATLTLSGLYRLGSRRRDGFAVMMLGNLSWILIGALAHSVAMMIVNATGLLLNLRGFRHWSPRPAGDAAPPLDGPRR